MGTAIRVLPGLAITIIMSEYTYSASDTNISSCPCTWVIMFGLDNPTDERATPYTPVVGLYVWL